MDSFTFLIALLARWLHVLAAIAAVGGTIFIRFALLPSLASWPEEQRKELHAALRARWSKVVMVCIALLLVTGLYNFVVILRGLPDDMKGLYHSFFGIKFLVALGIFFIASALVGRSAAFEKLRAKAPFWAGLNVALAVLVVCISGFLRLSRDRALQGATPSASASTNRAASTPNSEPSARASFWNAKTAALKARDPVAEAQANFQSKDRRFLAVMKDGLDVPVTADRLDFPDLTRRYGTNVIPDTTDAYENEEQRAYNETATDFARRYNQEMLRLLAKSGS